MAMTGLSRVAPLPLRLAAGATLAYHGYDKLFGSGRFEDFVQQVQGLALPFSASVAPEVVAHVAAWSALAGGALLILGFVTRLAAFLNAVTAVIVIWKVHLGSDIVDGIQNNFSGGYEFPLMVLGATLALLLMGAGSLSIDSLLLSKKTST
jgi:putative oxidoreductase